jgi:hypothetical protein
VESPLCIFCKRPFDSTRPPSTEHIVPKAGGGWLTTELVCKECNSFLGDHVDNIMNEPLLKAMRVEAGLATKDILDGVYFDADLGEVPGYLHEDGSFVETKDYFKRGGGEFVVIAPTPERPAFAGTRSLRHVPVGERPRNSRNPSVAHRYPFRQASEGVTPRVYFRGSVGRPPRSRSAMSPTSRGRKSR